MEVASEGERLGAKELWKAFDAAMNQAALARKVEALQLKGPLRCKLLAPQGAGGRPSQQSHLRLRFSSIRPGENSDGRAHFS